MVELFAGVATNRTGHIVDGSKKIPFKYGYMTAAETDERQFAQSIDGNNTVRNIVVRSSYPLNTKTRLLIDGVSWTIVMIKSTSGEGRNGAFTKSGSNIKYLMISTGAL